MNIKDLIKKHLNESYKLGSRHLRKDGSESFTEIEISKGGKVVGSAVSYQTKDGIRWSSGSNDNPDRKFTDNHKTPEAALKAFSRQ